MSDLNIIGRAAAKLTVPDNSVYDKPSDINNKERGQLYTQMGVF